MKKTIGLFSLILLLLSCSSSNDNTKSIVGTWKHTVNRMEGQGTPETEIEKIVDYYNNQFKEQAGKDYNQYTFTEDLKYEVTDAKGNSVEYGTYHLKGENIVIEITSRPILVTRTYGLSLDGGFLTLLHNLPLFKNEEDGFDQSTLETIYKGENIPETLNIKYLMRNQFYKRIK